MPVTATQLRHDIYSLLDRVVESGEPLRIERNGHMLTITADTTGSKLSRLQPAAESVWIGDPEDLFSINYMAEWDQANNVPQASGE